MTSGSLRIRGARQNNLRGFDVEIPRERLTAVTGVSGSGKSSLAFDTLFREGQRDALIERMMGESAKELGDLAAESVLTEVANIVASHVASGIADAHSDRLLPSLPTLAAADAAAQFETFLAQRNAAGETRYSCALDDGGREVGALLVFVPRAASA